MTFCFIGNPLFLPRKYSHAPLKYCQFNYTFNNSVSGCSVFPAELLISRVENPIAEHVRWSTLGMQLRLRRHSVRESESWSYSPSEPNLTSPSTQDLPCSLPASLSFLSFYFSSLRTLCITFPEQSFCMTSPSKLSGNTRSLPNTFQSRTSEEGNICFQELGKNKSYLRL